MASISEVLLAGNTTERILEVIDRDILAGLNDLET